MRQLDSDFLTSLNANCDTIIKNGLNEELSFIDISSESNSFKKIANMVMHIFYASPLNTKISSNSPINQYLKIEEFNVLKNTPTNNKEYSLCSQHKIL